jgi:hypothetical protein
VGEQAAYPADPGGVSQVQEVAGGEESDGLGQAVAGDVQQHGGDRQ